MTKLIGIITDIKGQSLFIATSYSGNKPLSSGEEFILLQNAYKFVNKLKVGLKVELTLNDDNDISFFKIISETPQNPQNKPIINKPIQIPINQNKPFNGQLFGICLKLSAGKVNPDLKDEDWVKDVNKLAKLLYNEVEK